MIIEGKIGMADKGIRVSIPYIAFMTSFGTFLEYYDFFAGSILAGTIWPLIFFAPGNIVSATIASIGAYASTYFARPIGAYIFGHFGDKIGRKFSLILTLLLLAVGSIGISVLPPYASIGIVASALLTLFRVVQGLGIGGEFGGGGALLMEFVSNDRRGFWGGIFESSLPFGLLTASGGILLASSVMSRTGFLDIGWRIVYGMAVIVAIIGMIMRYRMSESPLFLSVLQKRQISKWPASLVLKKYWRKVILLALAWLFVVGVNQLVVVFGNEYLSSLGFPISLISLGVVIQGIAGVLISIFTGYISDKIGRKRTLLVGGILAAISLPIFFIMVLTKLSFMVLLAEALMGVMTFWGNGVVISFFSENYPTNIRVSGVGLSYQLGGLITGILLAAILPLAIIEGHGIINSWPYVSLIGITISIVSIISHLLLKETKDSQLL
ncbi:MFS transporter [Sulfolobus sp. E11-6]|uniref:MFS transporter n=1 Tax=Sulfolobus sp. E11-6 TaxID=2663020 RepID=UPI0012965F9A|nr:MFS transporter [Sulfolobus sp. E11-6]QGA68993.1 MFS transporter [Sulfolobus sp. E11-6]